MQYTGMSAARDPIDPVFQLWPRTKHSKGGLKRVKQDLGQELVHDALVLRMAADGTVSAACASSVITLSFPPCGLVRSKKLQKCSTQSMTQNTGAADCTPC